MMMATRFARIFAALAFVGSAPAAMAAEAPAGAVFEERADFPNHVVYRPTDLNKARRDKLGVYIFGNGGCSADGTSSRNHLLEIAAHGYLVIAAGTIPSGKPAAGAPPAPGAPGEREQKRNFTKKK